MLTYNQLLQFLSLNELKLKFQFFSHTNQIPRAQLSHVVSGYCDTQI